MWSSRHRKRLRIIAELGDVLLACVFFCHALLWWDEATSTCHWINTTKRRLAALACAINDIRLHTATTLWSCRRNAASLWCCGLDRCTFSDRSDDALRRHIAR